jgi:hypothetical protein
MTQFSVGRFAADQHNLDVQLLSDWLVSPTAQAAYEQYGLSFQS